MRDHVTADSSGKPGGDVTDKAALAALNQGYYVVAAVSAVAMMVVAYLMSRKWDLSFTVNGFLAGLVAITCPCYWVSPTGSILLGGIAGWTARDVLMVKDSHPNPRPDLRRRLRRTTFTEPVRASPGSSRFTTYAVATVGRRR